MDFSALTTRHAILLERVHTLRLADGAVRNGEDTRELTRRLFGHWPSDHLTDADANAIRLTYDRLRDVHVKQQLDMGLRLISSRGRHLKYLDALVGRLNDEDEHMEDMQRLIAYEAQDFDDLINGIAQANAEYPSSDVHAETRRAACAKAIADIRHMEDIYRWDETQFDAFTTELFFDHIADSCAIVEVQLDSIERDIAFAALAVAHYPLLQQDASVDVDTFAADQAQRCVQWLGHADHFLEQATDIMDTLMDMKGPQSVASAYTLN